MSYFLPLPWGRSFGEMGVLVSFRPNEHFCSLNVSECRGGFEKTRELGFWLTLSAVLHKFDPFGEGALALPNGQ